MFCVECGKEGELYKGLCRECFLSKNVFVSIPNNIDVEVCGRCGSRRKGKSWVYSEEENFIEDVIRENAVINQDVKDFDVHTIPEFEDENNINVSAITHADIHGLKAEEELETKIRIKKAVCPECSKQAGGYWEAKVQLRGSGKGLSEEDFRKAMELVDSLVASRERKDKSAFLTKVEKIHNGLDFYIGSKSFGRIVTEELAGKFGGQIKESHKLVGRKDGKDVHRTTYAVRLLEFRFGDFLQLDEQVFQVKKLSSDSVTLRTMESGKNIRFAFKDLEKAKMIGGKELVKDMVVVSKSENEIQVLDPDTLKTVEVLVPEGFKVEEESVKVMKCGAGYFLVGED
jgi:nonsense-mediated mRNA decay protein 3